jgi:hypothetical protein
MGKKEVADTLSNIQEALTKELLRRIAEGTATSADLNIARQLLKDNNIDATITPDSSLATLGKILPFDRENVQMHSTNFAEKHAK